MKKFLLLAILVTSSLFAQAQKNKKSPEERAQARVEKISGELNLTDTQKNEVYELFLSEGKREAVKGENIRNLTQEERQTYIKDRKREKATTYIKLAEILDKDQYAAFQSIERTGKPVRVKPPHASQGKKNATERIQNKVDKLTEELSLTPVQQTQVKELLTTQQAERPNKKETKGELTKEEKEAKKAAWKATKTANDAKMKAILNADQYTTYQANKPAKGGKGPIDGKGQGKGQNNDKGKFIENRVDQLSEKLNLSETQEEQVTSILTKHQEARKGKRDLSEEAKGARSAARKEAKSQLDAEMKAVLTDTQYTTYIKESIGKSKGKGKRKGIKRSKKIEE